MKSHKLKYLAASLATSALILGAMATANAQTYPDRPIGVMVAYNPGGATDFQARIATLSSDLRDKKPRHPYPLARPFM